MWVRVTLVDMWSVGCIFGELIRGTVLFPGTDRILPPSVRNVNLKAAGTLQRFFEGSCEWLWVYRVSCVLALTCWEKTKKSPRGVRANPTACWRAVDKSLSGLKKTHLTRHWVDHGQCAIETKRRWKRETFQQNEVIGIYSGLWQLSALTGTRCENIRRGRFGVCRRLREEIFVVRKEVKEKLIQLYWTHGYIYAVHVSFNPISHVFIKRFFIFLFLETLNNGWRQRKTKRIKGKNFFYRNLLFFTI